MNDARCESQNQLNVFAQIEAICSKFRRDWKSGARPSIEGCLEGVSAEAQGNLFRNLLHIELDARRRAAEQPMSDAYLRRFPTFARLIRQEFFESTMMSLAEANAAPGPGGAVKAEDLTTSFSIPSAGRLGEYRLLRELGRGGFGVVYEAKHLQRQNRVALKTLPLGEQQQSWDDAERLHKFRREFRALAEINHPNLVGMQTLEVDGGQWFFTMDLVAGVDLLSYVRPWGELDESRLRAVLPQLASGILALHAQHIIHRDLKPSNVLVSESGQVTILDFGLVVELQQRTDQTQSQRTAHFAGTPMYAAPEQIQGYSTAASDWYSLGVILFEALSGDRPFQGTVAEIFGKKQYEDPPRLLDRDGLPQDLAQLADALLARDPAQRPDALTITKALKIESAAASQESTDKLTGRSAAGAGQELIGREKQLTALRQAIPWLREKGSPLALMIIGRSGEGKSALAEAFLKPLRQKTDVLVLSGRCYDRETVPYKAIDCLIDALVSYLRSQSGSLVAELLPADTTMLAHLFPVMQRVESIAALPTAGVSRLDAKQVRQRAFNALQELLHRIAARKPIVMFIDDLQWGDADSAEVLLQCMSARPAVPILFLGSYRSDEAHQSPFLRRWESTRSASGESPFPREVRVGPLSEDQCLALIANRFGSELPEIGQRAAELHQATGGNPYLIDQLIDCFNPETGAFRALPLQEVVAGRLAKLPASASSLLDLIAVSGQAIPVAEIGQAAGLEGAVFATITHMRSERLVRLIGAESEQQVDTYHDKIREVVLGQMPTSTRQELHRKVGETLEAADGCNGDQLLAAMEQEGAQAPRTPPRVFDLAYHFQSAGVETKAIAYQILAAEQARRQFALRIAIDNYQLANSTSQRFSQLLQHRIHYGLGETLVQAGEYEQADAELELALRLSNNQQQQVMTKVRKGEIAFRTRSVLESVSALESILRDVGVWVPGNRWTALWGILRETMAGWYQRVRFRRSNTVKTVDWQSLLTIRVLNILQNAYVTRSTPHAIWASLLALRRASRFGEIPELSMAWTNRGMVQSCILGKMKKADRSFDTAIRLGKQFDDISLQGMAHFYAAWRFTARGQFADSIRAFERATEFYTQLGEAYRLTYIQCLMSFSFASLCQFDAAYQCCRSGFESSIRFGQFRQTQFLLGIWSRAVRGNLPLGQFESCFQLVEDCLISVSAFYHGKCTWLLREGRTEEAVEFGEKCLRTTRRDWACFSYQIIGFPTLAQALRMHADTLQARDPRQAQTLRRRGIRIARLACLLSHQFPVIRPHALRELALAWAARGKHQKAFRLARLSCQVAQGQGAAYEHAESLLACGQLAAATGLPEAESILVQAQESIDRFEAMVGRANKAFLASAGSS
jgi:serine/threonine protein kinase